MSSHEIPRHWRLRRIRYRLEGNSDHNKEGWGGLAHFAEGKRENEEELFRMIGRVVSWTRVPGKGIVVALVEVEREQGENLRLVAQLTDLEEGNPKIGMRVKMVTRKLGEEDEEDERGLIIYGYKFKPIEGEEE